MTNFTDGPAKGQVLCIRRAPLFLRVVLSAQGKWDCLDQLADTPERGETCYAYKLVRNDGGVHVCRGGGNGGFFQMATYALIEPQPDQSLMQLNRTWRDWCESEYERLVANTKCEVTA